MDLNVWFIKKFWAYFFPPQQEGRGAKITNRIKRYLLAYIWIKEIKFNNKIQCNGVVWLFTWFLCSTFQSYSRHVTELCSMFLKIFRFLIYAVLIIIWQWFPANFYLCYDVTFTNTQTYTKRRVKGSLV